VAAVTPPLTPHAAVAELSEFAGNALEELCEASEAAIHEGGGFGWLKPPPRNIMEAYWKGVLLVPERHLFVARLDGVICGSAQLARPARNNEAQAFSAQLTSAFVAPWARGHGLARGLVLAVEECARALGAEVLNLDVRSTQTAAIQLYDGLGYIRWGTHPAYARVDRAIIPGHYYYKVLTGAAGGQGA
jgi:ribosomal protein S18 acetylase RimI-like enzyme